MTINRIGLTTFYLLLITEILKVNYKFSLGKNCQRTKDIV
jgi:hypothetical protein